MTENQKFVEGLTAFIEKYFGGSDKEERHQESTEVRDDLNVSKALDEELKQATFLVLSPDEVDEHGDIYDENEVRKACHNFQMHCRKANLFHAAETNLAYIAENYTAPSDFYLGEQLIKKGSWLQVWQVEDDDLWSLIKKGEINGVSVGCAAKWEDIPDDEES